MWRDYILHAFCLVFCFVVGFTLRSAGVGIGIFCGIIVGYGLCKFDHAAEEDIQRATGTIAIR